jgi:phenylacetate-CoA ligase
MIEAYVDALQEVARRILATGQKIASPRGIIVSAGVLTPSAREEILAAFKAPLFNRYGSREVGNVACSCDTEAELHVHEAWNYLEIVNDHGKACAVGEEGNILVTLFANRTMPLIRYRIEDRGTWANTGCRCGRNTKRMAAVCGRTSDFLIAPGNVRINGTALTTLLYKVEGIRRFQYRQTAPNRVILAIVPMDGVSEHDLSPRLALSLKRIKEIAPGVEPELKFETEILPSKSGKHRYIINEISR